MVAAILVSAALAWLAVQCSRLEEVISGNLTGNVGTCKGECVQDCAPP